MHFLFAFLLCQTAAQMTQALMVEHPFGHGRGLTSKMCTYRGGTDWDGHDVYPNQPIENLGSVEECCKECHEMKECTAYVFDVEFGFCWPKTHIGLPVQCPNCQSENFEEEVPPKACNVEYGSDRYGGDLTTGPIKDVTQPGECCKKCQENPDCISFVWRRDFHQCWLKGTQNTKEPCAACVLGDPK